MSSHDQKTLLSKWLGKFILGKPTPDEIKPAKKWAAFAEKIAP